MQAEKCLEGYILDDIEFACQLLARTMHLSYFLIYKVSFSLRNIRTRNDFVMVFGYFIGDTYCETSGVREYREGDGVFSFSAIIIYGASRFFPKSCFQQYKL